MYIRQECLFSFEEILKFQKENKLQLILSQLDFSNLINKLTKPKHKRGPKGYNPVSLINALIAMQLEKINDFERLKQRLDSDLYFKFNCGFDILKPSPSTSTFSRFLSKISSMPDVEEEFKRLVLKVKNLGIIDDTNVAIDATKLDSFEKAKPKSKISDDGVSPNWGKKKILMVMI
ncbi:transposase [Caloramator sp. mosi_1]|uniref:transposase n=1 Tax=Caloramator sp. mosi_1 TaxID=3023090 RepID=UPI002361795B|nr:transposase [Caloramator sp. mosi_1]WDC83373.1 transposase [Caloramator sp. mosi_1]